MKNIHKSISIKNNNNNGTTVLNNAPGGSWGGGGGRGVAWGLRGAALLSN